MIICCRLLDFKLQSSTAAQEACSSAVEKPFHQCTTTSLWRLWIYECQNCQIWQNVPKWSKMIQNDPKCSSVAHFCASNASSEFHFFRFFRLFQHSTRWQGSGSCSKTRSCGRPLGWSFPWSMLSSLSCWSGLKMWQKKLRRCTPWYPLGK